MFQNTQINRSSVAQVCFTSEFKVQEWETKQSVKFFFLLLLNLADVYDSQGPLIAQKLKVQ